MSGNNAGGTIGAAGGTAIGQAYGGPVGGAIGGAIGGTLGNAVGGLFGGGGSGGQNYGQAVQQQIGDGLDETRQTYQDGLRDALEALQNGEAEASDEIMAGLGMSIEERTKFFDVAKDNVQWITDFGKARQGNYSSNMQSAEDALGQSDAFLNHYKELIFNPDSIYDSEVYKSIKDRTIKEWGNFYSGKGLLGGNAQEAMVDRVADGAYNYLTGERNAALSGVEAGRGISDSYRANAGQELNAVNMGADASRFAGELAFRTGDANANDIMSAHGALANITQAFNPADSLERGAVYNADAVASARTAQANATLAQQLGADTNRNNLLTAGVEGASRVGSALLDNYFDGKDNSGKDTSASDRFVASSSTFGNSNKPSGWEDRYTPNNPFGRP